MASRDTDNSQSTYLKVFTLGGLKVFRSERRVVGDIWVRRKARILLGILATQRGTMVPRELLAEALWPDRADGSAESCLKVAVAHLRELLDPGQQIYGPEQLLLTTKAGYELARCEGCWVDLDEFKQASTVLLTPGWELGNREDRRVHPRELAALRRGLTLYGGDFLPEEGHELIRAERERLKEMYLRATSSLARRYAAVGEFEQAAACCIAGLGHGYHREALYREAMAYWYIGGNPSEAVRYFWSCRAELQANLGLEPSPETHALYRAILQGDPPPSLDDPAVFAPLPTGLQSDGVPAAAPPISLSAPPSMEVGWLSEHLGRTVQGSGRVCLVIGGPRTLRAELMDALRVLAVRSGAELLEPGGGEMDPMRLVMVTRRQPVVLVAGERQRTGGQQFEWVYQTARRVRCERLLIALSLDEHDRGDPKLSGWLESLRTVCNVELLDLGSYRVAWTEDLLRERLGAVSAVARCVLAAAAQLDDLWDPLELSVVGGLEVRQMDLAIGELVQAGMLLQAVVEGKSRYKFARELLRVMVRLWLGPERVEGRPSVSDAEDLFARQPQLVGGR